MEDERFDQCMERLKAGDKDALHEIYTACGPYIYHFILGIVKSREDAEDVTSEFFIRLWKSADRYRPGSGHKTYLMTIARNMAIDLLRSKGRESLIEDIFPQNGEDPDVYTTEERVVADQGGTGAMLSDEDAGIPGDPDVTAGEAVGRVAMEEALAQLKPPEPQIIHMKFALDMTFAEIAAILMMPLGTVTWKYREAIGKLRRCGYAF
ncbi:MAG: sigma-70 family RNA polymerase sigma factor [Lachnospiraceae bacterium]|nr:sigma-70 family RNA polymerase sigma factor [Lachnospiraceae bacterium]